MKKLIVALILIINCYFNAMSSDVVFPELNHNMFNSNDIVKLVKRTVPSEVSDAFLYATKSSDTEYQDTMRMYLLSIGKKESEWKYKKSLRPNKNGTYDVGYLMLNEDNIFDPIFNKNFMPKMGEFPLKNKQEFYLITCINFYKYLYNKYGCDASYAYNAGERRYIENRIPNSSYKYKADILDNLNNYTIELYEIAKERKEFENKFNGFFTNLKIENNNKCAKINVRKILKRTNTMYALFSNYYNEIKKKLNKKITLYFISNNNVIIKTIKEINGIKEESVNKYNLYNVYV